MSRTGAALAAQAAAIVCLAVAWLRWDDGLIEGAYFDRSVGSPGAVHAVSGADIRPWLAAAALLTVLSAALWPLSRRTPRRG